MYAQYFEFDGISSKDLGIMLISYDGFSEDTGTVSTGSEITFNTTKAPSSKKWNYHGVNYETQLTFSFQIGKVQCGHSIDMELSQSECAYLMRWLVRADGFHMLRFLQNEYENTYFNCQMTSQLLKTPDGKIIGMQLQATCDAPFGYSEEKVYTVSIKNGDSFQIYDDSDEVGSIIFDTTYITSKGSGKLTLTNDMNAIYSPMITYVTEIKDVRKNENITIKNHQITSDNASHSIGKDFNYRYPRLINLFGIDGEQRINTYTVSGCDCDITFQYRVIRKILP